MHLYITTYFLCPKCNIVKRMKGKNETKKGTCYYIRKTCNTVK